MHTSLVPNAQAGDKRNAGEPQFNRMDRSGNAAELQLTAIQARLDAAVGLLIKTTKLKKEDIEKQIEDILKK